MNQKVWDNLKRGDRVRSIRKLASIRRVLKVVRLPSGLVGGIEITRMQHFPFSKIPVYVRWSNAYLFKKV